VTRVGWFVRRVWLCVGVVVGGAPRGCAVSPCVLPVTGCCASGQESKAQGAAAVGDVVEEPRAAQPMFTKLTLTPKQVNATDICMF
jgi:hypothetical protein